MCIWVHVASTDIMRRAASPCVMNDRWHSSGGGGGGGACYGVEVCMHGSNGMYVVFTCNSVCRIICSV